jgi:hypothetical protein
MGNRTKAPRQKKVGELIHKFLATLKKLITSKNYISQYFPLELKFRVFPMTVFPGNSRPTLNMMRK